jgi:hypothetical protein
MKRWLAVLFVLVLAVTLAGFRTGPAVASGQTCARIGNTQIGGQGQPSANADILAFDVAADNNTIWVGIGQTVFKSSNSGYGFAEPKTVGAGITIVAIAISADYASDKTILVAGEDDIYRSTDDGNSWFPFAGAALAIRDPARDTDGNAVVTALDAAKDASGNLDVIVSTQDPTTAEFGEVLLYQSATGTWDDRDVSVETPPGARTVNNWEVINVVFSPKYQSDGVKFAVVTADNLATPARVVSQFSDAGWGFNWFDSTVIGTAGTFTRADLGFPLDFDVISAGKTYYFLGLVNTIATQGDAFRIAGRGPGSGLTNSEVRGLDLNEGVYSVAFAGNIQGGTLLAGLSAMARIWHTTDTLANQPIWTPSLKSPFGQGSTIVRAATSGGTVWASTQGADGGFHISTDSGGAFDGVGGGRSSEVTSPVPDSPSTRPATFTTTDLTISPTELDIRENVTISVLLTNIGDLAGSYEVSLKINAETVSAKEITLAGGASERVTFTTTKDTPPVLPVPAPPSPPPTPLNWWLIGGIVIGLVVVGLVLYVRRQRKRALE